MGSEIELWKGIPDYPEHEASSLGRIRKGERIISQHINKSGNGKLYKRCTITYQGIHKKFFVHVLICLTFKGPRPFAKAVCCHGDDDGFNNNEDNVFWGSQSYNCWLKYHKGQERLPNLDEVGDAWEGAENSPDFSFT